MAGTVLGGNYPWGTASRLISPVIDLPTVGTDEEVVLKFWQWFGYWYGYWNDSCNSGWGGNDYGQVQLQVYNTNTLQWSGLDGSVDRVPVFSGVDTGPGGLDGLRRKAGATGLLPR